MDHLVRKDLKDNAFDVVLRGYDKRQVDERLRILGAELAAARYALQAAQERIASLEDEVHQARSNADPRLESSFGARVEKILILAEEQAREVRNQADEAAAALVEQTRAEVAEQWRRAEQEAAAWRAEANRQAAEQDGVLQRRSAALDNARQELHSARQELHGARQELERDSERIRAQAQAEAEQVRKTVAQEADEVRKAARVEATQLVVQAQAEANRVVTTATEQVQQRERASVHELYQLSRLHDEINADLYRAKQTLDGLFGTGKPILRAANGVSNGTTSTASPAMTSPPEATQPMDSVPDRRQARSG